MARHPDFRLKEPVTLTIHEGEHTVITGPNGGGKSLLADMLAGRRPLLGTEQKYGFKGYISDNIKYVTFRDIHSDEIPAYYQQRWNQQDIGNNTPSAGDLLDNAFARLYKEEEGRKNAQALRDHLYKVLHVDSFLDKPLILLSSGETRKFQLARTLLSHPRVLFLDEPFIGLDPQARATVRKLLESLAAEKGLTLILLLSRPEDIPSFIHRIIPVADCRVQPDTTPSSYFATLPPVPAHVLSKEQQQEILNLPSGKEADIATTSEILKFNHVTISYGNRTILKDINWKVCKGEKWSLSGENGAGKSTLLSLIMADNPQAYACDITLFGRRRGTGESIWDIKRHIGYVSPEMHRAYRKNLPAVDIVASGLHDTIGLYKRPSPEEYNICEKWMRLFHIAHLKERNFLSLSSGEARLCLLARAFVKDPSLLILDEPLHGLDNRYRRLAMDIIDTFCRRPDKTLVMVTHYKEELPPVINHTLHLMKQQ